MKHKVTLKGRVYEVEVDLVEPLGMQECRTYAPAPTAPAEEAAAPVPAAAPAAAAPAAAGEGACVASPMPGSILQVNVTVGQTVKEGDVLITLEAMKMENEIMAPKNGTVTQVAVSKGTRVETGTPLVYLR